MIDTSFRAHNSLNASASPVYVFFNNELLIKGANAGPLLFEQVEGHCSAEPLYVGEYQGQAYYTVELDSVPSGFETIRLWDLLNTESFLFNVAGRAMQLLAWEKTHQFCGFCATKTEKSDADWSRKCPNCGQTYYPRLSPCVIMAIRRGDQILLAQRPGSTHKMYTVLAGFVEPGESAEHCVMREVKEEVGIKVKNIRYFGSQPWPFPGQLMLGFIADYDSGKIDPDLDEVQNASWFDYRNLPEHPSLNTISGRLIEQAVAEIAAEVTVEN